MFFDYVKIGLVAGGRKKVLSETWLTLKFMRRRFFRAWGLYLLAGLVFVALTVFYLEIARILPKNRPLLVLLVFLWQQFYILGRQCEQGAVLRDRARVREAVPRTQLEEKVRR